MEVPRPEQRLPGVVDPGSGLVVIDLPCRRCGYNLRTLAEAGRCPECGSPVGLSTRGNFLQFADPDWVARVARGLRIVYVMIIIGVVTGLAVGCLSAVTPVLPVLVSLGLVIGEVYGVWLMTAPDPSGIGEEKNVSARKVVRVSTLVEVGASAIQTAVSALALGFGGNLVLVVQSFRIISRIAQIVAMFARFSYFAIIAERIPDPHLVNRAFMLRKGILFSFLIGLVGFVFAVSAPGISSVNRGPFVLIAAIIGLPAAAALVVFGIWTVVYIFRMQQSVTHESEAAAANWAWEQRHRPAAAGAPPVTAPTSVHPTDRAPRP
ncbi:MAG TPA: hypothetical protein P5081_15625 [Phycisphaerae bacterium]|nr:hypothetical protein [Phycisphaerae bacterium]HRW54301.1 hypothetical protein [Phycisphaerae bacterium]